MNIFSISIKLIRNRKQRKFITGVIIALGALLVVSSLATFSQLNWKLQRAISGISLVIGPKMDPEKLIWSTLLFVEEPEGNVSSDEFIKIMHGKFNLIDQAFPVIVVDNYQGFRIVATTIDYLNNYGTRNLETSRFPDKTTEALIGSRVAAKTGLINGKTFNWSDKKGDEVIEHKYTVVGTVDRMNNIIDNLILTNIDSYQHSHKLTGEKRVTAIFVRYATVESDKILPDLINASSTLMAAAPHRIVGNFLLNMRKISMTVMYAGFVLLALGFFSLYVNMNNFYRDRMQDFILMKSLGASGVKLALIIVIQAGFIAGLSAAAGIMAGHLTVEIISLIFLKYFQSTIAFFSFLHLELDVLFTVIAGGIICVLPVAFKAYRTSLTK